MVSIILYLYDLLFLHKFCVRFSIVHFRGKCQRKNDKFVQSWRLANEEIENRIANKANKEKRICNSAAEETIIRRVLLLACLLLWNQKYCEKLIEKRKKEREIHK